MAEGLGTTHADPMSEIEPEAGRQTIGMMLDTDVLIAGAGPVGLALANFLGRYGHRVIVVESRAELIDYPRGVGLDDESFRSIQTMDLVDEVLPYTVPHHVMRIVNGRGQVMVTNDPQGEPLGWPRKHGFIQPLVDRTMYEGLSRYGSVEVRFGHRLVEIEDRDGAVCAEVETTDSEGHTERRQITARFLVGCEGGTSFTRKWMNVNFEGQSPSTRWVVVDVRNDPLGFPNVYLGADPERPYVSIGLPHGIRRWEFMLFENEPSERVEDDAFVTELLNNHVPHPSDLEVIRRRVFTHHGRIASSFRKGNVLIAGDAAHLMPVWLGQGWNSGMRDATNLGWKLSAVLRGTASAELLDSYDLERRDHAKALIDLSMTFGAMIKPTHRVVAAARDLTSCVLNLSPQVKNYFTDMRFKPMPRYGRGVVVDQDTLQAGVAATRRRPQRFRPALNAVNQTSPVGSQFIQPRVTTATATAVLLDDVLGDWWTVAVWGNDPARLFTADQLRQLGHLGARLVSFTSETQRTWAEEAYANSPTLVVGDHTGALKKWFDARSIGVVFLRPDRFVAAACLSQQAGQTLDAVLSALSFMELPAPSVVPASASTLTEE